MMEIASAALPDVATLYAAAGANEDGIIAEKVRHEIAETVSALFPGIDDEVFRETLAATLAAVPRTQVGREQLMRHIAVTLHGRIDEETGARIIEDLCRISGSDGLVTGDERRTVAQVAAAWNLGMPAMDQPLLSGPATSDAWSAAHDLALVYLGLAHGTDDELSRSEVNAMVQTLQRWVPELTPAESASILRDAMERYASGPREPLVDRAVGALRSSFTPDQRRKALADLVRIANADGVFLDVEEDLIIRLQREWEVDPDALYE